MKKIFPLLFVSQTLSGCFIMNTPGFYSGYKKLSADEKQHVVITASTAPICNIKNDQHVYAITGTQLLNCLKNEDTSVVYFWSPNCQSDVCISMSAAQYYCDKRNYKLYVIAEYYDLPKMMQQSTNATLLYSINNSYYGTEYCGKYTRLFKKEIAPSTNFSKNELYKRFFFFKNDKLVHASSSLIIK